jgi:hypothetical protein
MKLLALALLWTFGATAQTQFYPYWASTGNVSLSSQTYQATLQQPAATCGGGTAPCSLPVAFPSSPPGGGGTPAGGAANSAGASIYCSVACVATVYTNCTTPATATSGTVVPANSSSPPPVVQFYSASNISGCGTGLVFNVPAGAPWPLDMSAVTLPAGGNLVNLTISVASVTATVNITFYPWERH